MHVGRTTWKSLHFVKKLSNFTNIETKELFSIWVDEGIDQQILEQFEILDLRRSYLKAISTKWHQSFNSTDGADVWTGPKKAVESCWKCEQQMWHLPEKVIWLFYCSLLGFVFESDCNISIRHTCYNCSIMFVLNTNRSVCSWETM